MNFWKKVLVFSLLLLGFLGWRIWGTIRWGTVEGVNWFAAGQCEQLGLSEANREKVRGLVATFAARIGNHEIGVTQGFRFMREFDRGPLFLALMLTGFRDRFLFPGSASREARVVLLNRFFAAAKSGKISTAAQEEVTKLLVDDVNLFRQHNGLGITEKARVLKNVMGESEIHLCFDLMEKGVAAAGPPLEDRNIDLAGEAVEAISRTLD